MDITPEQAAMGQGVYEKGVADTEEARQLGYEHIRAKIKDLLRPPAKAAGRGPTAFESRQEIYNRNPLDSRGHETAYTHQETVNRYVSQLSGPGGPIQIDLGNDRVNQAFMRVIGTEKAVWNKALNVLRKDEDKPIPLFKAIRLWESNESPADIQGRMANVKTILSKVIGSEFMRQLAENEKYGWAAPYVEKQLGPHSEVLFNRIVNSMMYIPRTGDIVMAPKAQQQQTGQQTGPQGSATSVESEQQRRLRSVVGRQQQSTTQQPTQAVTVADQHNINLIKDSQKRINHLRILYNEDKTNLAVLEAIADEEETLRAIIAEQNT